MLSVNTNAGAALALRSLQAVQTDRAALETRISTGLKVASPKDNGGVWAISQGLGAALAGLSAEQDSLSRTEATLEVSLAALDGIGDILMEMRETALALSDSSLDAESFAALEGDYKALFNQTRTMVENASFNGVNLLDGSTLSLEPLGMDAIEGVNLASLLSTGVTTTPAAVDQASVYPGYNGDVTGGFFGVSNGDFNGDVWGDMAGTVNGTFTGDIYGDFSGTITNGFTGTIYGNNFGSISGPVSGTFHNGAVEPPNPFSFSEEHAAFEGRLSGAFTGVDAPFFATDLAYKGRVNALDNMMEALGGYTAQIGTRLKTAVVQQDLVAQKMDVTTTARGRLVDADLARDSARLNAAQTREQLAIQALSIANAAPSVLTRLFA